MTLNISQALNVFKQAILGDESFREGVCEIVLEKTNFTIDKKKIIFKNSSLYIKTDPYTKVEISLHKDEILKAVQEKYPKKNIKEIF